MCIVFYSFRFRYMVLTYSLFVFYWLRLILTEEAQFFLKFLFAFHFDDEVTQKLLLSYSTKQPQTLSSKCSNLWLYVQNLLFALGAFTTIGNVIYFIFGKILTQHWHCIFYFYAGMEQTFSAFMYIVHILKWVWNESRMGQA